MSRKKDYIALLVPSKAWNTLSETLSLDTESSGFDPDLRREIRKALGKVVEIWNGPLEPPLTTGDTVVEIARKINEFEKNAQGRRRRASSQVRKGR